MIKKICMCFVLLFVSYHIFSIDNDRTFFPPTNLHATVMPDYVTLYWDIQFPSSVNSYEIYKIDEENNQSLVGSIDNSLLEFTDDDIDYGIISYFVRAIYLPNTQLDSVPYTVSINEYITSPSNLQASYNNGNVSLMWDEPYQLIRDLVGYRIYCNYSELVELPSSITSYSYNELEPGDYSYYVLGIYETGDSGMSNIVNVQVESMIVPTNLQVEYSNNSAILSWEINLRSRSLTAFRIYKNGLLIAEVDSDCYQYSDVNVEDHINSYYVTALYGESESESSNWVYVTENNEENIELIVNTLKVYPNPFNPDTKISFILKERSYIMLSIYNINGQLVKTIVNDYFNEGNYNFSWNGINSDNKEVSSGIYFVNLRTDNKNISKKIILLK